MKLVAATILLLSVLGVMFASTAAVFPQPATAYDFSKLKRERLGRKGRGTRDQIANIRWIIEKAREFQKNIYFCFID